MPMTLPALDDYLSLPSSAVAVRLSDAVLLIEQAVHQILSENAAVTALVAARIYAPVLPQSVTYPAIAMSLADRDRERQLNNRGSLGVAKSRFYVHAISKGFSNYAQVKRIAEAVRLALEGYRGTVTDSTVSPVESVLIQNITPVLTVDNYDDPTQIHRVTTGFDVVAGEQRP